MTFPSYSSQPTSYTSSESFVTWNRLTIIRPSIFPSSLALSVKETLPTKCLRASVNRKVCQRHPPQIGSVQPTGQSYQDSNAGGAWRSRSPIAGHTSQGGARFRGLARGLALLEGFEFLRIETHVAEESDEREAAGCKVEVIDKPGELRFAKYHAPTRQHNLGQPWDSGSNFLNKFDRL